MPTEIDRPEPPGGAFSASIGSFDTRMPSQVPTPQIRIEAKICWSMVRRTVCVRMLRCVPHPYCLA